MTAENPPSGLYVHVPFCSAKCTHCGFFSLPSAGLIPAWLEAVEAEAALYAPRAGIFDTLYLGGGTPSHLSAARLARLFGMLRREFGFSDRTEITLEINPEDAGPEKIEALVSLGVDRLNLGVQSFDDGELSFMGRRHNAADSVRGIEVIRRAGCANLGLDLIYGLPRQSVRSWLQTLDLALEHEPAHLSCYQLTVEPSTPLERKVLRGEVVLPDEELSREFFLATSAHLSQAGYLHYEVSNFAREERFISRHNSKYWSRRPYLGLGPAAHSFSGRRRWWNHSSLKEYLGDLKAGRKPQAGEETLNREDLFLESVCLGLRTLKGIGPDLLPPGSGGRAAAKRFAAQGLGVLEGGRFTPTPEGMVVADSLALAFSEFAGE